MSDKWKRLVRERMACTGETYTQARKGLLLEKAIGGDAMALADLQRCDARMYRTALEHLKQVSDSVLYDLGGKL